MNEKMQHILDFWFGEIAASGNVSNHYQMQWWKKDPAFDQDIHEQFSADIEKAMAGEYDNWCESAQGRLALIILLDQFSRNIYRDTPKAFMQDPKALQIALDGVAANQDRKLLPIQRVFFYMPLEHSEDKALQQQCVALFRDLDTKVAEDQKALFNNFLDFAIKHQEIVERFERFPHRNTILGRESTDVEQAFLQQPGSSF